MANIAIICKPTGFNFIRNYDRYMDADVFQPRHPKEIAKLIQSLHEYDTIILEWANDTTKCVLKSPNYPDGAITIVRVHDHEIKLRPEGNSRRSDFVPWDKVDAAWFINRDVEQEFKAIYSKAYPNLRTFFLPNAVDPAPFDFSPVDNNNIGLMSLYTRPRKRIDRAIELALLLPDYQFYISVDWEGDPIVKAEYDRLQALCKGIYNVKWHKKQTWKITLDNYPHVDVNAFWKDMAYAISTSEREGFGYNVAEGALCGAFPLVYEWEYGRPRDFWNPFVCSSVEEMAKAIRAYRTSITDYQRTAREYVLERFHPEVLVPKLMKEVEGVRSKVTES